jgi:DNA-binding transcriptional ArsR family regulator/uncharacterized protein YndB with AHSA1/START domain
MQLIGCISFRQPIGCLIGSGMDEVFKALADQSRRELLDNLNARNGQTLRELCTGLNMARQSVSKHLAVLEAANLVTTIWRGREKLHYLNAEPINAIAERWINRYHLGRVQLLAGLKAALEQKMFVYTTYIRTTPGKLWQAITDPAFTSQYWGVTFDTDWKPGSSMIWDAHGVKIVDPAQVILESEPFTKLSFTWHSMTPEFATAVDAPADFIEAAIAQARTKVTFTLEQVNDMVKLTVEHSGEPGSVILEAVNEGWPPILSSLKTLLETGTPLSS